jgi:hypothetical protein
LRKAPPTLKVKTSFSIVASGATELSECDSSAEVAMRRTEGEGQMSEQHMLDPTPELPDDTPIDRVRFPARIQNVLVAAGLKTGR